MDLYCMGMKIALLSVAGLLAITLLYILFQYVWAYVDDVDNMRIVEKFPSKWMESNSFHYTICDGEDLGMAIVQTFLLSVVLAFTWPLTITALILYGIIRLLRCTNRLKKRVSKLAKVAHKHLDKVNIEEYKED